MASVKWWGALVPFAMSAGACSILNAPDDAVDPGAGGAGGTTVTTTNVGGSTGGAPADCTSPDQCDDGDPCTVNACDDGMCVVASTTDPDDDDACTADSCDPATGMAVNTPIPVIDDGNACTVDFCDPERGMRNEDLRPLFEDDFSSNDRGWSLEGPWEIGPAVQSGVPSGTFRYVAEPGEDHTDTSDNGIAGVVIGGYTDTTAVIPIQYLESPEFDATLPADDPDAKLYLSYWRWLLADWDPFMAHTVEVFDGANWQVVFELTNGPVIADTSWRRVTHDITLFANDKMKIRFGHAVLQAGVFPDAGSWNLDDVVVGWSPVEIDDGDLCTETVCDPATGTVTHDVLMVDDGDPCTLELACDAIRGVNHYDARIMRYVDFSIPAPIVQPTVLPGQWEVGPAMMGMSDDPAEDSSPSSDNRVLGVNLGGDYSVGGSTLFEVFIPLTFIPSTPMGTTTLTFQRWLNAGPDSESPHSADIVDSTNMSVLNILQTGGLGIADNKWTEEVVDLTNLGPGSLRLRLRYQVTNGAAIPQGGWNIDDVIVTNDACAL
ncbi:MAG: hypothetical protein AAF928_01490 [Myxococcota bacterium]